MYTNKSALDDALHSMQRRIVHAVAGCAGVIAVSGGFMAAPEILSEASVNTALAKLAQPVQAVERALAGTRRLASIDAADRPVMRPAFHGRAPGTMAEAPTAQPPRARQDALVQDGSAQAALAQNISAQDVSEASIQTGPLQAPAIVLASIDPAAIPEAEIGAAAVQRLKPGGEEEIPSAVYEGPDALNLVQTPVPPRRPADLPWSTKPRPKTPSEVLGLIGPNRARAERCLTQAVYFEARSEPYRGQMAVAQVVMNRVFSPYYPGEVCAVVFQNAHRYLSCQFTFACEGRSLRVTEHGAWRRAQRIARQMLDGEIWRPEVAKATHYHADYVSPNWISEMRTLAKHGRHIFYRPHRWGDGREEAGWVPIHQSPIPRPRPVEVAASPMTLAAVQDVEGPGEASR